MPSNNNNSGSNIRQRRSPTSSGAAVRAEHYYAHNNDGPPIHSSRRRNADGSVDITPVRPYKGKKTLRQQQQKQKHKPVKAESLLLHFDEYIGWMSPWAWLWGTIFLSIPVAYVYIGLVLLRELCRNVDFVARMVAYLPVLPTILAWMQQSSVYVEAWCIIEGLFYVALKFHMRWLQTRDTLEASLSAAPLMDGVSRRVLWQRMMETEAADVVGFIRGWLLEGDHMTIDDLADQVSVADIRGFLCWSMFEGRSIEHLTTAETKQLESFLEELQVRISLQVYGSVGDDDDNENSNNDGDNDSHVNAAPETSEEPEGWAASHDSFYDPWKVPRFVDLPVPKRMFSFREDEPLQEHSFFADLYETYRRRYERMRTADFSPVQDLANRLAAPVSRAVHEGLHTAESSVGHVYESLVPTQVEERLSAVREATLAQMTEAWNSVKNMRERLETARFLSSRRTALQQQLRGYKIMLDRMLENSHAADIPRKQMAILMRRITECNDSLEGLEKRAQSAFVQATGFARKNLAPFLPNPATPPQRFAMYSTDPLLGIATYPLGFHLLILALTEIPLRAILLLRKGFVKKRIGPVSYYFHPGKPKDAIDAYDTDADSYGDNLSDSDSSTGDADDVIPIVFVHGIGIGLVAYLPLIDALLATGRPLLLPEIPYVSGFRPWQSPNAVLSPQVVTSTLSAMLASHGFLRATFIGHSYGTTWLSYMCKYAEHAVAALMFLDPICFCLHAPRLTKSFVYLRPDPGTISYIIRTDVIVNWTIQRSFPWAWVVLFTEQIRVPTTVFLSSNDMLVPADKVESYLRDRSVPVCDFDQVNASHFESDAVVNSVVFRGDGHGGWTERAGETSPTLGMAAEILCQRARQRKSTEQH